MMMGAAGDSAKPTGKTTFIIPIKQIPSKKKTKEGEKEREMVEMTKTAQQTFAAAAGAQRPPVLSVTPVVAIAKGKEHQQEQQHLSPKKISNRHLLAKTQLRAARSALVVVCVWSTHSCVFPIRRH
jgi:hypothetical protein